MSEESVQDLLRAGITAVKQGNRQQGRHLLEAVLEADGRNERAWLWLSGAVDTVEERQICLENVLAINPDNALAQKGLNKLAQSGNVQTVTRHYAPLSTASALLYPESQTKTWEWRDPTAVPNKASSVGYRANEGYDDVWNQDEPLCGYCAQLLSLEETRCPRCKKQLEVKTFRYPRASTNVTALWVLLLGVGQLYLLQAIYNLLAQNSLITAVGSGVMTIIFVALAVAVHYRQSWAHLASIYLLVAVLLAALLRQILPADLVVLGLAEMDEAIQNFLLPVATGIDGTIRLFTIAAAGLALFYDVFKAAPDFEKTAVRRVAALTKTPKTAADFNAVARQMAQQGLWATAVLHWQRAAANAPNHIAYQESLGRAYARLGFLERSLDALQSAHQHSNSPERRAAIQKLIQTVQAKMAGQPKPS